MERQENNSPKPASEDLDLTESLNKSLDEVDPPKYFILPDGTKIRISEDPKEVIYGPEGSPGD